MNVNDVMISNNIDERLYPPNFHSRYHHLTCMRRHIERITKEHIYGYPDQVLLDYGCGIMPYRKLIEPFVSHYIGLDLKDNKYADLYVNPDGGVGLRDDIADIVLSIQVLEHVLDPIDYLRECYRLLKPGGKLILSTHGFWIYHPDPQDYWRWTSKGLQKIVEAQGLRVIQSTGVMGLASTAVQLFQDSFMPWVPRKVRSVYSYMMQRFVILFDWLQPDQSKIDNACVYFLVGQKTSSSQ